MIILHQSMKEQFQKDTGKKVSSPSSFFKSKWLEEQDQKKTFDHLNGAEINDEIRNEFIYPRVIGGMNIYSDVYYPFNLKVIKEWKERIISLGQLKVCIEEKSSDCSLKSKVRVFYITKNIKEGLTSNILSFNSNKNQIFIQEVDTKNN